MRGGYTGTIGASEPKDFVTLVFLPSVGWSLAEFDTFEAAFENHDHHAEKGRTAYVVDTVRSVVL